MTHAHIVGVEEQNGEWTRIVFGCKTMALGMVEFLIRYTDIENMALVWEDVNELERSDEEIERAQEWTEEFHSRRH